MDGFEYMLMALVFAGVVCFFMQPPKMRVVEIEWLRKYDWDKSPDAIITVSICQPWSRKPRLRRYRGNCTVWHNADTGARQSTEMEGWLCNRWTKAKWEAFG